MRRILLPLVLIASAARPAASQESTRNESPEVKLQVPARTSPEVVVEVQGDSRREAPGPASGGTRAKSSPQRPLIGFIDSPSATCYQPDPRRDACYLNWYYMSVDASPSYMLNLWVFLNPNLVSDTAGFFQTGIYVPYNMLGQGFRVACGPPVEDTAPWDSSGTTKYFRGNQYAYTIRAKDSAALTSANYGTATCPPFIPAP